MHLTATFVPSLLVARMTRLKAPVPNSLSSKLYFRANSEFASARSPPPPAFEPCVVSRERSLGSAASALSTCVYAIEQTHHGDDVASMAWNLHAIEQAPSGLAARSLSLDRRSRANALLASLRSAGRRARVAKRSAPRGARNSSKLRQATLWPLLRAPAWCRLRRRSKRHSPSRPNRRTTRRAVAPQLRPWIALSALAAFCGNASVLQAASKAPPQALPRDVVHQSDDASVLNPRTS